MSDFVVAEVATEGAPGCILLLSKEGTRVLSAVNVAERVHDLATDGKDQLYVAAGNHIFRYGPKDVMQKTELAGGEKDDPQDGFFALLEEK